MLIIEEDLYDMAKSAKDSLKKLSEAAARIASELHRMNRLKAAEIKIAAGKTDDAESLDIDHIMGD